MPDFLLADRIKSPPSLLEIETLEKEYIQILNKHGFPPIDQGAYPSVLKQLKRDFFDIGPYIGITVFEAANRIASDLTLLRGILILFNRNKFDPNAKVKLRLGTMHENGKGDFSVIYRGKEAQGEVFDVAPSFFKSKLYKTLTKWKRNAALLYVVFNADCLEDASCSTYFESKKIENRGITFLGVESWHR